VQSAHWTTFPDDDDGQRCQLELSVVPPGWIPPERARQLYPRATAVSRRCWSATVPSRRLGRVPARGPALG
jgi:hypothetical protein